MPMTVHEDNLPVPCLCLCMLLDSSDDQYSVICTAIMQCSISNILRTSMVLDYSTLLHDHMNACTLVHKQTFWIQIKLDLNITTFVC